MWLSAACAKAAWVAWVASRSGILAGGVVAAQIRFQSFKCLDDGRAEAWCACGVWGVDAPLPCGLIRYVNCESLHGVLRLVVKSMGDKFLAL